MSITLDDLHIEEYEGKNGPGHKLAARVIDVELAGGREPAAQGQQATAPRQQEQGGYRTSGPRQVPSSQPQRTAPAASNNGGFADMDDDIPW